MVNVTNINKLLNHIQIVMVNTTLPANIGSAARAMHTMGLQHLCVIDPKLPIDDSSYAHAAGATHILDKVSIQENLASALANSQLVFAASSRNRSIPKPVVTPSLAAQLIEAFIDNNTCKQVHSKISIPNISILFGREDRGLTNEELAQADYHIQIDANPNYPVLNVAAAVQVISSFLYAHFSQPNQTIIEQGGETKQNDTENSIHNQQQKLQQKQIQSNKELIHFIRQDWDEAAITHQQQQQLNEKVIELMQSLELADKNDLRLLPQRLARLSSRVQLDVKEYQLLTALIGKLHKLKQQ